MTPSVAIRHSQPTDLPAILDILNQAIAEETIAITDQVTLTERLDWFDQHTADRFPILVADKGRELAGWCSLSAYRPGRKALRQVVEISYFIHSEQRGRGIASQLIEQMIALCPALGYKTIIAMLLEDNQASIRLLLRSGFVEWGHMPKIVNLNGSRLGHLYYGLNL
jgi:phosphinothricin acetyltransferase